MDEELRARHGRNGKFLENLVTEPGSNRQLARLMLYLQGRLMLSVETQHSAFRETAQHNKTVIPTTQHDRQR